jgi:hypothetical protein
MLLKVGKVQSAGGDKECLSLCKPRSSHREDNSTSDLSRRSLSETLYGNKTLNIPKILTLVFDNHNTYPLSSFIDHQSHNTSLASKHRDGLGKNSTQNKTKYLKKYTLRVLEKA